MVTARGGRRGGIELGGQSMRMLAEVKIVEVGMGSLTVIGIIHNLESPISLFSFILS